MTLELWLLASDANPTDEKLEEIARESLRAAQDAQRKQGREKLPIKADFFDGEEEKGDGSGEAEEEVEGEVEDKGEGEKAAKGDGGGDSDSEDSHGYGEEGLSFGAVMKYVQ